MQILHIYIVIALQTQQICCFK